MLKIPKKTKYIVLVMYKCNKGKNDYKYVRNNGRKWERVNHEICNIRAALTASIWKPTSYLVLRWDEVVDDGHLEFEFSTQLPNVLQQTLHLPLVLLL